MNLAKLQIPKLEWSRGVDDYASPNNNLAWVHVKVEFPISSPREIAGAHSDYVTAQVTEYAGVDPEKWAWSRHLEPMKKRAFQSLVRNVRVRTERMMKADRELVLVLLDGILEAYPEYA